MAFSGGPNSPFVVWSTCFLWIISMFAIAWSLLLFFSVGDLLLLTGTDLINAFVLLSAIIMFPTNVSMLCSIAHGRKIDHRGKIACCPLWLSIVWIIVINTIAAIVTLFKILSCREFLCNQVVLSMKNYRSVPKYKHFLDNIQWCFKCCGLDSYKDWFNHDWHDKIRDYEWDPSLVKRSLQKGVADSVPLSCCKSGSCVSNYLSELGTYSINTTGCGPVLLRLVMLSLNIHLILFLFVAIFEIIILKIIVRDACPNAPCQNIMDIRHIMQIKRNFDDSSGSCQGNPESDDDLENSERPDDYIMHK